MNGKADVPIRANVPISAHPGSLGNLRRTLDLEGTAGRQAFWAAQEAMTEAYRTYAAIQDAERELFAAAPPVRVKPGEPLPVGVVMGAGGRLQRLHGRERELAQKAQAAGERALGIITRRKDELTRHRDALAERVDAALQDPDLKRPEGIALAAEVRSHVKALTVAARTRFLRDAIDEDDRQTVVAVLSAPPYLTGLTGPQLARVRSEAAARWAAVDHAQMRDVELLFTRVSLAERHLRTRIDRAISAAGAGDAAERGLAKLEERANG